MATKRSERDALIVEHLPLVRSIARTLKSRLPKGVEIGDLVGYGMFGLIDAIDRYDSTKSVPLKAFAYMRIRGAMVDSLRASDLVPRSVRRKAAALSDARNRIEVREGRTATRSEVASSLGIDLSKMDKMELGAQIRSVVSLDAPMTAGSETRIGDVVADTKDSPLEQMLGEEDASWVSEALSRLPERERIAVTRHYLEERSLREIGDELGVSESRACQLRKQGVERLRIKRGWRDERTPVVAPPLDSKPGPQVDQMGTSPIEKVEAGLRLLLKEGWLGSWRSADAVLLELKSRRVDCSPLLLMKATANLEKTLLVEGRGTVSVRMKVRTDADKVEASVQSLATGARGIDPPAQVPVPPPPVPTADAGEDSSVEEVRGSATSVAPLDLSKSKKGRELLLGMSDLVRSRRIFARKDAMGDREDVAGFTFARLMGSLMEAKLVEGSGNRASQKYVFTEGAEKTLLDLGYISAEHSEAGPPKGPPPSPVPAPIPQPSPPAPAPVPAPTSPSPAPPVVETAPAVSNTVPDGTEIWKVTLRDGTSFIAIGSIDIAGVRAKKGAGDKNVVGMEFLGLTAGNM